MGLIFSQEAFNQGAASAREAIKAKRDADSAMNVARVKADSDAKLKQEERDYKEEVRVKKAFSDSSKQFQAIAPKNSKLASMGYNSTNEKNGIPDRKYTVDTNGENFTFDGSVDESEKWKVIQADLSAYKGEGLYRVSKTGILESRQNDASEFTPTDTRGMSSRMFREMDSDSQLTKTKMIQVETDGKIIEKTRDWYDSIPDKDKPKIVESDSIENKTNEDKFVESYMKSNPSANRVEASTAYANRSVPTVIKIENQSAKSLQDTIASEGVDLYDYNIGTADKKTVNKIKAKGLSVLRQTSGKDAGKIIYDAKKTFGNIERLDEASTQIESSIKDGKDVNFIEKLYRDMFGKYTDVNMTDEDYKTLAMNKQVAEVFNSIRHELYGSVLTVGENKNFYDQAASLYESNPSLVIGIKATVDSQIKELEALEMRMGEDIFRTQFGNRLEALKQRGKELDSVSNKSSKKNSAQSTYKLDVDDAWARIQANRK